MLLYELLKYVDSASGGALGVEGTSLFIGLAPSDAQSASIFVQQGGERRDYAPGLRRLSFQVFTRDPDIQAAEARASGIADVLTLRAAAVGPYHVYECNPRHEPLFLGREDSGLYTFVINYAANWRAA
ncbi:minor capsid protein [Azospirillum sp. Sh1]|uniref:minor capsid protein n=1 Tax=Azospirillum sp. Sh1 TaxID=2607285 RepID=UPI0011EE6309|nr:minor capsid protein [Azospirillum sp. Sh1]KAA0573363.1 hypothetical protein FZ029_20490 [Azospirillum sp. Sh1]